MLLFDLWPFTLRPGTDLQWQRTRAGSRWRHSIRDILEQTGRKKLKKKAPSGHMRCVWSCPKSADNSPPPLIPRSAPQPIYNLGPSDPCMCWICVGLSVAVIKNGWTGWYWSPNHSSTVSKPPWVNTWWMQPCGLCVWSSADGSGSGIKIEVASLDLARDATKQQRLSINTE